MKYLVPIGRIFYSLIFLMAIASHFSEQAAAHAAKMGVPYPNILVPLSGVLAFVGGLSIALGYKAKAGAWLIILFLVPVTLCMHAFWKETDVMAMHMQMANFMKNTSMIGTALLIAYFGAGPLSLDKALQHKLKVKGFIKEDLKKQ